ncbi:MBL fold metallo-hydrolase [Clostridium sp. MCC353]|uniref:MBL fold metallo-hydrolase n=1 Tax=Clostridium sp. MCC353 TaxID=2592646 RepID=UPI001C01D728|nr:MBL fold metallo-hydrolase [Clostridium sp. MCC353]MBT9777992.1 MBL fold metallo-hydrolase [Clostridium sp. MCC353]
MINLRFLGFGAAFYPPLGNTSAWFLHGRDFYLLDCGEDVFHKVYELEEYKSSPSVSVFITHMHTDHIGSLGELIAYSWFKRNRKVKVYYPDERLKKYLELSGINVDIYDFMGGTLENQGLTILPQPVFHDPSMGCFGYRIKDQDEAVYYSGDSGLVSHEIVDELKSGRLARLYLDTSKSAPRDSGHGNFEAMKERIGIKWRDRVVCMHLDCDFREEIEEEGFAKIFI